MIEGRAAEGAALLRDLVEVSDAVREVPGRLEKRDRLASYLRGVDPNDARLAASYLAGETPQGRVQVGWRLLDRIHGKAGAAEGGAQAQLELPLASTPGGGGPAGGRLLLRDVDAALTALARAQGKGASLSRQRVLTRLFARAGDHEADFLHRLILGELRQGALRALVIEALAAAFLVGEESLRRAVMFAGNFGEVVGALARDGGDALARFTPRPLVPILPMLAGTANDFETAVTRGVAMAVEWKLDGVRIQVHRAGDEIRIHTRNLRDVTASLPEVVALAKRLPARSFILDGEVIARDDTDRPIPFQDLMSLVSRGPESPHRGETAPVGPRPRITPIFFDLLYQDGDSLMERPFRERRLSLERLVPSAYRIPHRVAHTARAARVVYEEALNAGHEGVVLKELDAPYVAGRRGTAWRKLKPAVTLDLVLLAAEWGSGRRRGFLSNLHLGARVEGEAGRFLMLGKTFKGLTDAMLHELTEELPLIETGRDEWTVFVKPVRVVEIAFDGLQRSARYDSGLALRFARVKRFRPDKEASEAATIEEVRRIAGAQAPR